MHLFCPHSDIPHHGEGRLVAVSCPFTLLLTLFRQYQKCHAPSCPWADSPQEQWHSPFMYGDATLNNGGRGKDFRPSRFPDKFNHIPCAVELAVAGCCRAFCAEQPSELYYAHAI